MRNKTALVLAAAGLGAAVMIIGPAWAGSETGRMMKVDMQITMHMSGMPAISPRSSQHDICMPADKFDAHALQRVSNATHGQCTVQNFAHNGNTITYDVVCKAPAQVTSHAVIHLDGEDAFTGTTHTAMSVQGHDMTADAQFSAKRTGSCTYTPPASS